MKNFSLFFLLSIYSPLQSSIRSSLVFHFLSLIWSSIVVVVILMPFPIHKSIGHPTREISLVSSLVVRVVVVQKTLPYNRLQWRDMNRARSHLFRAISSILSLSLALSPSLPLSNPPLSWFLLSFMILSPSPFQFPLPSLLSLPLSLSFSPLSISFSPSWFLG